MNIDINLSTLSTRDMFAHLAPRGNLFTAGMQRATLRTHAAIGIDAIIALVFDEYDDQQEIPSEILAFMSWCSREIGITSDTIERIDGGGF